MSALDTDTLDSAHDPLNFPEAERGTVYVIRGFNVFRWDNAVILGDSVFKSDQADSTVVSGKNESWFFDADSARNQAIEKRDTRIHDLEQHLEDLQRTANPFFTNHRKANLQDTINRLKLERVTVHHPDSQTSMR